MTESILSYQQEDSVKLLCEIDLKNLLPAPKQRERFNKKWNDFKESDPHNNEIFALEGDVLKYQSEQLIPSKPDDRRTPLLLILGNPASHSVKEGMFFSFEGNKRSQIAANGIKELSANVDSLITIPNEKLLSELGKNVSLLDAFKAANDVLLGAVQGIAELITRPGLINVDFADVRTVMSEMGMAMMGSAVARGENRAAAAAEQAVGSPLLEDINLSGARGILVNITAGLDLTIGEFEEVGQTIKQFASDNATVVVGTVIDPELTDELRVTVVATGLGSLQKSQLPRDEAPLRVVDAEEATSASDVPDYQMLSRPTVLRQQASGDNTVAAESDDLEYLDIPAFLRRQAD